MSRPSSSTTLALLTISALCWSEPGFNGNLLTLELTESVLLEPDRVTELLGAIRSLGVGIAIDDFGTGYSSLSYLQQFPVTSVKIDRSFVSELSGDTNNGLVRSIIAIADSMNLTTVAEGIETVEQLTALKGLKCGLAQGFHLSRPVDVHEIDAILLAEVQPSVSDAPAR